MPLTFRTVTFADAERLFRWRNDELDRLNSHHSELLQYDAHCRWLEELLADPKREQFIVQLDGTPVGMLRIDSRQDVAELAWSTDPDHRGRGLGKAMLKQFLETRPGAYRAEIFEQNIASRKMAEYAGMALVKIVGHVHHYRYGGKRSVAATTMK